MRKVLNRTELQSLQTNLLTNPGFDISSNGLTPDNWESYEYPEPPTPSRITYALITPGRDGTGHSISLEYLTNPGGYSQLTSIYQTVPVTQLTQYTLSGYMYLPSNLTSIDADTAAGVTISISWWDSTLNTYLSESQLPTATSGQKTAIAWTKFSGPFTSPTNAAYAQIKTSLSFCIGKVFFDDIQFYLGACAAPNPGFTVS